MGKVRNLLTPPERSEAGVLVSFFTICCSRFYYYQGRIKAIQLDYSEAHKYLIQSSRKAPQNSANGFKQHVTKLSITVELLLGNIPERQVFLQKDLKAALHPYLQVKMGIIELAHFTQGIYE